MSGIPCPACDAETVDGLLCGRPDDITTCVGRLYADLVTIASLLEDLGDPLARRGSGGGGASGHSEIILSQPVIDARDVIGTDLVTWARELDMGDLDETEHADIARWLADRVQRVRTHAAADEIVDAFAEDARLISRLTDRIPERRPIGQCACGSSLTATLGAKTIRCRDCGTTFDVARWREVMIERASDYWLHRDEVVTLLSVKRGTLRSWIHRRELEPDHLGRVKIADVQALVRRGA